MIQLQVAKGCGPTARTLAGLLKAAGVPLTEHAPKAVVCWGAGTGKALPSLNRHASAYNKLEQLQVLRKAGVQVVPFLTATPPDYPCLARKRHHVGGRDIIVCLQAEDAKRALTRGSDYFTMFVPSATEFRAWVYRRKHLGMYEKVLAHPHRYKGAGRNYDNGYAFNLVSSERVPRAAVDLATRAVDALGLDFGAVDILQGTDGKYYVLEVNTAPGVEGDGRQVIQALAAKIARWVKLGFPKRKGDAE